MNDVADPETLGTGEPLFRARARERGRERDEREKRELHHPPIMIVVLGGGGGLREDTGEGDPYISWVTMGDRICHLSLAASFFCVLPLFSSSLFLSTHPR